MDRIRSCLVLFCCIGIAFCTNAAPIAPLGPFGREPRVELPGHVPDALSSALASAEPIGSEPVTLTIVLRRTDEEGFQAYLRDVYDPGSLNFRKYMSPQGLSERFGPSDADYEAVAGFFRNAGFSLLDGSANRLTLSV